MQRLRDRYGYKFLLFDSRNMRKALTAPMDLVVARAPLYFAIGSYLARIRDIPLINDFRDPYMLFYERKFFPTLFLLHRNSGDATSVTMRAYIEEYRLDPRKVFYNPNAAPLEWTMRPDRPPKNQICYVGNVVSPHSNFPLMLAAFKRVSELHPQLRLVIGGYGSLLPEVQRLALDMGVGSKVQFLGRIAHEEVPQIISESLLGLALNPWLGQKHVEYAACGRPCLGVRGRIDSEDARWIVTAEPTPTDVAEKMARLVSDEALRTRLGEIGRMEVRRFYNWDQMAELWHGVIQRLLT
jgi:glycosyltransferase involved in cell wall biosynthesis